MLDIEKDMFKIREGDMVLSPSNAVKSSAIIIGPDRMVLTSDGTVTGMSITNGNIVMQGKTIFTGKGTTIEKENFTENPEGAKMYTYQETVYFESVAKEQAYKRLGEATGKNTSDYDKGMMPIITDIASGPLPHTHTISMKHVHRVEPHYIYTIPWYVKVFKGFMSSFTNFLKA